MYPMGLEEGHIKKCNWQKEEFGGDERGRDVEEGERKEKGG